MKKFEFNEIEFRHVLINFSMFMGKKTQELKIDSLDHKNSEEYFNNIIEEFIEKTYRQKDISDKVIEKIQKRLEEKHDTYEDMMEELLGILS